MKVLFCDQGYSESRRHLAPLLPGFELVTCDKLEVASHLRGIDAVVPYGAAIDSQIVKAGSFGLVQQFGVGLETVDVAAATDAGVWVARVPSAQTGNAESVAEHAILLMLALSRKGAQLAHSIQQRVVGEPAGLALAGKTACIIGLGGVGSELGLRLQAFRMRLFGVRARPILGNPRGVAMRLFGQDRLHEALGQADYVIVCATLDAKNRHLIDHAALAAMKQGAFLINIARGGLVDSEALLQALESGHLAGAGLDVFSEEPIDPAHPLLRQNVVVTPHIAGVTDLSYAGIAKVVAENVQRYAGGLEPLYAVNAPRMPRRQRKPVGRF
ncbi:MAG: 2-hydroxyacid dehydrogenase [Candidatus Eremiobacteraeota bacterium]|nr:2-hydroxyacid dehydrogenase [Candidatus Eremiobacteraeota bacterium]